MAVVLKTTVPETVPGVRIPLPPPLALCASGSRETFSGFERLAGAALSARIPQRDSKDRKIDLQIPTSPD